MGDVRTAKNNDYHIRLRELGSEKYLLDALTDKTATEKETERVAVESTGTTASGFGTYKSYYLDNGSGDQVEMARIEVKMTDGTAASEDASVIIHTMVAGTLTPVLTINNAALATVTGDISWTDAAHSINLIDNTSDALEIKEASDKYLTIDTNDAANRIQFHKDLMLGDNVLVKFGDLTTADFTLGFDATVLELLLGTDDLKVVVGDGTTSADLTWYGNTTALYYSWDASASRMKYEDDASLQFGTGAGAGQGNAGDIMMAWNGTLFAITQTTTNSAIKFGVDDDGIDIQWFGATASKGLVWDQSADTLIMLDATNIQFGTTSGIATLGATGTTLSLLAVSDNNTFLIGNATNSFDVKIFGADSSHYFTFDTSANRLKFEDDTVVSFGTGAGAGVANAGDVYLNWDASKLVLIPAVDDTNLTIGDGTLSMDIKTFGNTTSLFTTWDASASALIFEDNVKMNFGTGSDVTIHWDATVLQVLAAADNTVITLGASGNSFDIKTFGAGATTFTTWDASADSLIFEDSTKLVFGTGSDVTIAWDGTDLDITCAADNSTITIGASGNSFDLKVFGAGASAYFTWDTSADHLKFEDNVGVGFGSNTAGVGSLGDIVVKFDGTDLLVTQATADTNVKWGVSGAGINHIFYGDTAASDMEWDQTNDRLLFKDNAKLVIGTGGDDTISHDATNSLWTHTTGDLTIDNTLATGSTIMLLGTDTTATDFQVQNNSAVAILTVTPLSATAGTVTTQGHRNAVGQTAVAITGATTLTLGDSGGIFTVAQSSTYDIDLPSPTTGPGCSYFFSLTAPGAFSPTITVDGGAATFVGTIVEDNSCVVCTGSTITFVGTAILGDSVEIRSIATNLYHVRAFTSGASKITIA